MKTIVTGGCGFIGYNLTKRLLDDGWEVHVIDISSERNIDKRASYIFDSITKYDAMEGVCKSIRPDVVFHLAAVPRVSYSIKNPLETTISNVLGTVTLLEAIRKNIPSCRFVASSSSSVYGGASEMPTRESHPTQPRSPYALQKLELEEWSRMYADLYNMDVCCLRYFNVFGPHSLFGGAYSTVLSAWMYYLFVDQDKKPFLEGDGKQSRDFCYVDNVVQANILAAQCPQKMTGHIFNIAQGQSHDLLYVKDLLERISGKKLDLEIRTERVGDVKHTLADISHAQSVLGYNPTCDFDEQVKIMANWYQESYPR